MPITVVGAAGNNVGTGTSSGATLTWPANTRAGDVAYYFVVSNTGAETYTFTGWTKVVTELYNGTVHATACFRKVLDGTETGSVGPTLGAARRWATSVAVFRGVNVTTPEDVTLVTSQRTLTTTTTAVVTPAITPTSRDTAILAFASTLSFTNGEVPTYTWAGYTEQTDTCSSGAAAQNQGMTIATSVLLGGQGTSQNPPDITTSLAVSRQNMYSLALRPAPVSLDPTLHSPAILRASTR
jgi:hypothetical protein